MAPHAPGPYYVQINYHGLLAPHSMQLSTKTWNPGSGSGTFDIWTGGVIVATAMVTNLVDKLLPMFNSDTGFDNFIIFKQLLETDTPLPVYSAAFSGKIGTNVDGSWAGAVEKMFIARSSTFGIAKLDLLDACSGDNFAPVLSPGVDDQALIDEWFSDAKGWAARDNGQVTTFLKITKNLNQKLRKEYRYT